MEAKFLASVFSFLSIFLAINAQTGNNLSKEEYKYGIVSSPVIYYGDVNVKFGDPFSITCIISVNNPIHWLKDDEPLTRHNLRHGRDEHSYVINENPIEGENHKIEAQISVKHALKVHEGKYRCNNEHENYHMLRVYTPQKEPRPQTQSPFVIISRNHNNNNNNYKWPPYEPTESISIYETINDLTPSSNLDDDVFTNKWDTHAPSASSLPTQDIAIVTSTSQKQNHLEKPLHKQHDNHYHHHINNQHHFDKDNNKIIYTNASVNNYDGSPTSASSDKSDDSVEHIGYMNVGYDPLNNNRSGIRYSVTQPVIPPPRTATADTPYYTTTQEQPQQKQQLSTTLFPLKATTMIDGTRRASTMHNQHQLSTNSPTWHSASTSGGSLHATHAVTAVAAAAATSAKLQPTAQVSTSSTMAKELLVPNYDRAADKLKIFNIRDPLVLSCNITQPGLTLTWEKNYTDVTKIKELQGRFKIIDAENKFYIEKTDIHDDGLYSCVTNNERKDFNVVAQVIVGVPSHAGVVEGEKLSITCTVLGTDPELSWVVQNSTITNSTGRYILKPDKNIQNAILIIENVDINDKGTYKCIGRNIANNDSKYKEAYDACTVRVKGKFAALWPFLGICAEVLILCTIILIYEKRRNKTELEESDTDPQEH